jgi:hypothetical protein
MFIRKLDTQDKQVERQRERRRSRERRNGKLTSA